MLIMRVGFVYLTKSVLISRPYLYVCLRYLLSSKLSRFKIMSTRDQIVAAARENDRLLSILDETDLAPSALKEQNAYINDLESNLTATDKDLQSWERRIQLSKKQHEKFQSSTVKRFAYKVTGKKSDFEEKASKEERAYFDAVQDSLRTKQQRDSLAEQLPPARNQQSKLAEEVKRHEEAQTQLDKLYDSVFGGPTKDFPEEDAKELALEEARHAFSDAQDRLNAEKRCISILREVERAMMTAAEEVQTASSRSQMDIIGVGGTFADLSERSHLSAAQGAVAKAQSLLGQAQRAQPLVGNLPPMEIADKNLMSDIVFDNVFSDMSFDRKIQESLNQVMIGKRVVSDEINRAKYREQGFLENVTEAAKQRDTRRAELQDTRKKMFAEAAQRKAT